MCKDHTLIEHFWLMHMLGNFGAKWNFIILYFLPLTVQKSFLHHWEGWYLSKLQINSAFFKKKLGYCSQHNVLRYECYHCQTKVFSPSYLPSFSKFSYHQNMFWSKNLSSNMPKITSFLLKNRKNRPALGTLSPDSLCLRRLGATLLDSRINPISLQIPHCALNYNRRFKRHKEKDSNIIKLVSKSVAVVVMCLLHYFGCRWLSSFS